MMPGAHHGRSSLAASETGGASVRFAPRAGRPGGAAPRNGRRPTVRGVVLPIVLVAAFLLALIAAFAHANLLVAQRLAARELQSARANEAAEAGLDWALARLNGPQPLDARCEPTGTAAGHRFRDTHAGAPPAPGASAVLPHWPSPAAALQPACRVHDGAWQCACPGGDLAALDPIAANVVSPGFRIRLAPHPRPGLMSLTVAGCSHADEDCLAPTASPEPSPGTGGPSEADADQAGAPSPAPSFSLNPTQEARAHRALLLAHLPALSQPPAAALTVHGSLTLGAARWELAAAAPPEGGLALHTGGPVQASALLVRPAPGTPAAAARRESDATLVGAGPAHRFAQRMRLGHADWQALPTVRRIDCHTSCDAALAAAIAPAEGFQMIWLEGGLHLARAATLGTPEHPLLLVSNGPVELLAPVRLQGLVYATGSTWRDEGGSEVLGAVIAEGPLHGLGAGTTRVRHDPTTLARLATVGTFVRVPGSWKDFP